MQAVIRFKRIIDLVKKLLFNFEVIDVIYKIIVHVLCTGNNRRFFRPTKIRKHHRISGRIRMHIVPNSSSSRPETTWHRLLVKYNRLKTILDCIFGRDNACWSGTKDRHSLSLICGLHSQLYRYLVGAHN